MTIDESSKRKATAQIARARHYAIKPERVRHLLVTEELASARIEGWGDEADEDICLAAGYANLDQYWQVAMSEPMKATAFAHLLARLQMDPTERLNPFDPRSKVRQLLDAALCLAMDARERFFLNGDTLGNAMLRPRDAALWLLSMPKRRDIVPAGLRALLEPSALPSPAVIPPSGIRTNLDVVAEENCKQWFATLPAEPRMTKASALAAAKEQFQPLSDKAFGRAWDVEAPAKGWSKPGRPTNQRS